MPLGWLQKNFPRHFYLGEETATKKELDRLRSGPNDSEWTWIVDPIDGTLNFVSTLNCMEWESGLIYKSVSGSFYFSEYQIRAQ